MPRPHCSARSNGMYTNVVLIPSPHHLYNYIPTKSKIRPLGSLSLCTDKNSQETAESGTDNLPAGISRPGLSLGCSTPATSRGPFLGALQALGTRASRPKAQARKSQPEKRKRCGSWLPGQGFQRKPTGLWESNPCSLKSASISSRGCG